MRARRVLHARRARIDLESNARSGRVAPRELALPGMRRTAHRSENVRRRGSIGPASGVWHKRPRSRPHLRRPPQLGSDSLGSADASLQTRRPSHARRAVPAAWVLRELLSDSHVRAIAELGSNFDACMRAAHAGVKEKRSARLPGSLKRRVSSIMETSRNYSNAELRKVSVRDRGRVCCGAG